MERSSSGSARAKLPALLPAKSDAQSSSPPPPIGESAGSSASPSRPKRLSVAAACNECRRAKRKCSATRPICEACVERGLTCAYPTNSVRETHTQALKRRNEELEDQESLYKEFFGLLTQVAELEAAELVRRVRSGDDVNHLIRQAKAKELFLRPAAVPESRRFDDIPYYTPMPASLLVPGNIYLESALFKEYSARVTNHAWTERKHSPRDSGITPVLSLQDAEILHPALETANISQWTNVSSDNRLLRELLESFLISQCILTAAFLPDLFVESLVAGRPQHCSSLLVNAVLAAGCHSHPRVLLRPNFWDPHSLKYLFLAEAKRLWELEVVAGTALLTTVQAAVCISLVSTVDGQDKIGTSYLEQAVAIAHQLDLFSPVSDANGAKMQRSMIFTAWSLYTWQSWQSFYFFQRPILDRPPASLCPDPALYPTWYGELLLVSPSSSSSTPLQFGPLIKANFAIRSILHDMATELFEAPNRRLSVQQAIRFRIRLEGVFLNLPGPLKAANIDLPDQLMLHIEYFGIMIALLQPLVDAGENPTISNNGMPPTTLRELLRQSKIRVETLIRLYYRRHGFDSHDLRLVHWLTGIGDMANEALKLMEGNEAEWEEVMQGRHTTVMLCAAGLERQGRCCHLSFLLFRALIKRMTSKDRDLLQSFITSGDGDESQELMIQYIQARYVVPVVRLDQDPSNAMLDELVDGYERMKLNEAREMSDS